MNQEIGSFWYTQKDKRRGGGGHRGIGLMELLSIKSFIDHGYNFTLYTYDLEDKLFLKLCDLFDRFKIEDASKIVPFEDFFLDDRGAGIAGFSDYFRFKMLDSEFGKDVWVDLDMVCLNFYDFSQEDYIFSQEMERGASHSRITTSLIKFPKNSDFGKQLIREAENTIDHRKEVPWGIIGPNFLAKQVKQSNLEKYSWDYQKTCQIPWEHTRDFLKTDRFDNSQPFLHLFSEMWNIYGMNKNRFYDYGIYGNLLQKHNIKELVNAIDLTFNFTLKYRIRNAIRSLRSSLQ